ncbi:hypothetical protein [Lysinibacillus sp. NPDC093692]|uniref:hypothetical protein n=1 Tax=Lysinibacillus sp. NPDC093692 TaxID=3390578 RepID=UPI003D07BC4A
MNIKEYRALDLQSQIEVANARMLELKAEGKTTKDFKNGEYNVSHQFVQSILKEQGYLYDVKIKQFVPEDKIFHSNLIIGSRKQKTIESNLEDELTTTTTEPINDTNTMPNDVDWDLLKLMLVDYKQLQEDEHKSFEPLLQQVIGQDAKATSFKLRSKVLDDWTQYVKDWGYVTSIDLTSAALLHFMQQFPLPKK